SDNALSWATAFYANSLQAHLAKTEPRLADSLKVEGVGGRIEEAILKLKDLQGKDGAWSWFKGMPGSLYMTTQITELMARLQCMTGGLMEVEPNWMYRDAWKFLSAEVSKEVQRMKELEKEGMKNLLPSEQTIQYLYIGALDKNLTIRSDIKKYLLAHLAESTRALTIYGKAVVAIIMQQADKKAEADEFLQSLMEYSVMNEEMGRYFDTPKAEYSWFSYKIPTQVMAIEALHRMNKDINSVEQMKQCLLKQKQAQAWETPIATSDAVYALLTTGKDWLQHTGVAEIKIGDEIIRTPDDALGYVEKEVSGKVMDIRQVSVEKASEGIGWGAVYAEFEEDLDKVAAQGNALKVSRTLYKDGRSLPEGAELQVGDKITVRLTVIADRDMDFVQVKDERAACMEPVDALSGYRWNRNMGYYQETKDASTSFYMDMLRKGTHVLEYEVYITSSGRYSQGIATAQSVYAPEFVGHGVGDSLMVK
ncbi:MAG: alpha-2-macroglobulin, partial [Bacteroidaceae bacterium]|nr:alpha-2-macroglobulin [Bacteroidaceae bacterium]